MPTYSYACTECGNRFDVVQEFTDDALTTCEKCDGRLRKIFGKVGVVFKGSGFYRTDSRESGKSSSGTSSPAKTSGSADSAAAKPAETSSGDSAAKPADKPASAPAAPASKSD